MRLLLLLLTAFTLFASAHMFSQTAGEIYDGTKALLGTLTKEEQKAVSRDFDDTLRTRWTNLPVGMAPRPGLRYGDLSEESKIAFHHLLTTLFSSQGYLKTTSIMLLDDILNEVYATAYERQMFPDSVYQMIRDLEWGFEEYYLSIWGQPDAVKPWGLKFEGHHVSINLSVAGDNYSVTPLFMGTDPAEVHIGKYAGLRMMSKEEDYGFQLINALDTDQKATATLSQDVPGDIITNPSAPQRIDDFYGIQASALSANQKELMEKLILEYLANLETDKFAEHVSRIRASGIDAIYFAWIGSYERLKPHYYVIHGPDFIIEYDNVGFNNDGNHIHTIWREKGNDFGEDMLREHRMKHKH